MVVSRILAALLLPAVQMATAYDPKLGLVLAHVEKALYCGKQRFEHWDVGDAIPRGPQVNTSALRFIENADTQAAAGVGHMLEPDGCVVSMRGTKGDISSVLDGLAWLSDFERDTCGGCQVHFGFYKSYLSIKDAIFGGLKDLDCKHRPVFLVGHSMGAAGLTYLLYDLLEADYNVSHMYALESPRPGNPSFQQGLGKLLKGMDAWRVTHYKDLVPHVPPTYLFYRHALREIYYTHEKGLEYRECGMEDDSCSDQWGLFQMTTKDHMWYQDINPCSCSNETRTPPGRAAPGAAGPIVV